MIVENEKACAVVSYDLISPKGKPFQSIAAENWKVKEGKLDSLRYILILLPFSRP